MQIISQRFRRKMSQFVSAALRLQDFTVSFPVYALATILLKYIVSCFVLRQWVKVAVWDKSEFFKGIVWRTDFSRDLLIHKYLRFLAEFCFNSLFLALFATSGIEWGCMRNVRNVKGICEPNLAQYLSTKITLKLVLAIKKYTFYSSLCILAISIHTKNLQIFFSNFY